MESPKEFLSSFKPATDLFNSHVNQGSVIRILTHNDADGVASGGILSNVVKRAGAPFKTTVEKRLDEQILRDVAEEKPSLVVLTDFGSGYLELVGKALSGVDTIILDHHMPIGDSTTRIVQVNPLLHGIDGSRDIAASGVSYFFAKTLDANNVDLSPLGLVGALGDQQDKGEKKSLKGINTLIEDEATAAGLLSKDVDLIFYGHETRPIARAIANTTTPFIPSLSGREDSCVAFLDHIGIPLKTGSRMRSLSDLDEDEKQKLFSALSSHMVAQGCNAKTVYNLIGTIYTFKKEAADTPLRDGREYSSLLNACARMRRPSLGIGICLGDRGEVMKDAEETLNEYRRKIGGYLDWVRTGDRIKELNAIYVLRAGNDIDENIVGVVSSILLGQGILKSPKPIVSAANSDDGTVKISSRIAEGTAFMGIHLGKIMQEAAGGVNGAGGGHDNAAGAFIPQGAEDEFLRKVDELVAQQWSGS
jgi:single-stranded-DNA-specific exonuclease